MTRRTGGNATFDYNRYYDSFRKLIEKRLIKSDILSYVSVSADAIDDFAFAVRREVERRNIYDSSAFENILSNSLEAVNITVPISSTGLALFIYDPLSVMFELYTGHLKELHMLGNPKVVFTNEDVIKAVEKGSLIDALIEWSMSSPEGREINKHLCWQGGVISNSLNSSNVKGLSFGLTEKEESYYRVLKAYLQGYESQLPDYVQNVLYSNDSIHTFLEHALRMSPERYGLGLALSHEMARTEGKPKVHDLYEFIHSIANNLSTDKSIKLSSVSINDMYEAEIIKYAVTPIQLLLDKSMDKYGFFTVENGARNVSFEGFRADVQTKDLNDAVRSITSKPSK